MKLWEVLKELEENPKKVFECNLISDFKAVMSTRDGYFDLKIFNYYGELISQEIKGGAFNENIRINRDWQEVKQPVTWQEAIEAWAEGKKITCECEGVGTFFRPSNVSSACFTAKLITHGTWYIED